MSAVGYYWPDSGRLDALGTFPSKPPLDERGAGDGVGARYVEMQGRGELSVSGEQTVPIAPWFAAVLQRVENEAVACIVADRYKQAEIGEAIHKLCVRASFVWRGVGYRGGGEDCERFRRAAYDGAVQSAPSLLLRSAFADAVVLRDPANNLKLSKGRSHCTAVAQGAHALPPQGRDHEA